MKCSRLNYLLLLIADYVTFHHYSHIELKRFKNIFISLSKKNLYGRYKSTFLGFSWHFVTPIMMLVIYYVVFNNFRNIDVPDFWVYLSAGVFPFNFMISCLTGGSTVIVNNPGIVKKMNFPKSLLIYSHVICSFIIMIVGYFVVISVIIISGFEINYMALLSIVIVMPMLLLFVIGYTLFFSAITVIIRDIQYILSTITIAFYFITPMYFLIDDANNFLQKVIWINPFTYYVEAFHQSIYYGILPSTQVLLGSMMICIISFIVGAITFNKLQGKFAERL